MPFQPRKELGEPGKKALQSLVVGIVSQSKRRSSNKDLEHTGEISSVTNKRLEHIGKHTHM